MNLIDTLEKVNENKSANNKVDEAVKKIAPSVNLEVEDIKEQLKGEKEVVKEEKVEEVKRVKSFNVTYDFGNKTKTASLSSKIMDAEARAKYERVLVVLAGGHNFETLPAEIKNRHYSLARIACQLIDPPSWVLEAVSDDLGFCFELGRRLIDHENAWFRWNNWDSESNEIKARFSISG